jgi:hypothetical protein
MPSYEHPKIFADFLTLFKQYYAAHGNLPKIFRVTIGDEILRELSDSMKIIVMANLKKQAKEDFEEGSRLLKTLRGKVEILKAYFLIGWEMKLISHGFYADLLGRIEEISKQAAKWQEWFQAKTV